MLNKKRQQIYEEAEEWPVQISLRLTKEIEAVLLNSFNFITVLRCIYTPLIAND